MGTGSMESWLVHVKRTTKTNETIFKIIDFKTTSEPWNIIDATTFRLQIITQSFHKQQERRENTILYIVRQRETYFNVVKPRYTRGYYSQLFNDLYVNFDILRDTSAARDLCRHNSVTVTSEAILSAKVKSKS